MQQTYGYGISKDVREKIYAILATLVKVNRQFAGEYEGEICNILYDFLPMSRKVFLYKEDRDSIEAYLEGMMDACRQALSEFGPKEGQEPVFIRYGELYEHRRLGRWYDREESSRLFMLMYFDLAA
jgi:hypothetical protein